MKVLTLTNIMIAIVLLTSPFLIGMTTSVGEYDAWADYNGDGKIDIRDIASTAIAYGSGGDPNRNVTVTKHASKRYILAQDFLLGAGVSWSKEVKIDGFAKISVLFKQSGGADRIFRVYFAGENSTDYFQFDATSNGRYFGTLDVANEKLMVSIASSTDSTLIWVEVYCIA
jgi:hypothetical protein